MSQQIDENRHTRLALLDVSASMSELLSLMKRYMAASLPSIPRRDDFYVATFSSSIKSSNWLDAIIPHVSSLEAPSDILNRESTQIEDFIGDTGTYFDS